MLTIAAVKMADALESADNGALWLLAAYRLGDSPAYVISLMIPYTFIVLIAWMAFFVAWYLLGIPMGPGYPIKL